MSMAEAQPGHEPLKDRGNHYFAEKKYDKAIGCYSDAIVSILPRSRLEWFPVLCKQCKCKANFKGASTAKGHTGQQTAEEHGLAPRELRCLRLESGMR